ncbi:MAG: glycosyltransferase family 39 protein [Phycisphaerales bacterium]|nr:glycosyltransferase family 39 protein [Phycisphaerales bacterium]
MTKAVDILLLAVVCYFVYFGNLARHEYIETEGLRATVVAEMLERDGYPMPTVHHAPYLNKPPLYAWTEVALARRIGEFNEQIARIPSALSGCALVLLMYCLGERWIGRGAGLAAGAFTLLCPTIADFAVRAELDLPFSFFCTCNIVLTFAALRTRGVRAACFWIAAYALALIAAMWKGPHSLIFMWLVLFGQGFVRKDWRWLRSLPQWAGLAATLGVLIWWTRALSAFAGPSNVGNIAAIELLARLVPYRLEHLTGIFTFIPMVLVITLPASVFVVLTFSRRVRHAATGDPIIEPPSMAMPVRLKACATGWWGWMRHDELRTTLAIWIVPCLLFMLWAPAKATRYSIPLFPPLILLATFMLVRLEGVAESGDGDRSSEKEPPITRNVWRWMFGVFAAVGVFAIVRLAVGFAGKTFGLGSVDAWRPWAFLAAGCLVPFAIEWLRLGGRSMRARLILLLVVLLGCQPVVHDVWWPVRVKHDSQRATAERIDEIVPTGAHVYILGVHEFHDVAIYAETPFDFVPTLDVALARAKQLDPNATTAYAMFRTDEAEELTAGTTAKYETVFDFDRLGKDNKLVKVESP